MKPMDLMDALGELPDDFIEQKLWGEPEPHRYVPFFISKPFLAGISAASLLLTIGLGVSVWSRQQKIEPRPPVEPSAATFLQTETETETTTRTETTVQVTTASPSITQQTGTTQTQPETTVTQTQITTAPVTVMTSALTTSVTALTTAMQTETAAARLPETSPSTKIQERTDPVETGTPTPTAGLPTGSTAAPVTETSKYTGTPGFVIGDPAFDVEPTSATEPVLPELAGFEVTWDDTQKKRWHIRCLEEVGSSPAHVVPYKLQSDEYRLLTHVTDDNGQLCGMYFIIWQDKQNSFMVHQYKRDAFSFTSARFKEPESGQISGRPCIWGKENGCWILYWDDGSYSFKMTGYQVTREAMKTVAESLVQDTSETQTATE